MKRDVPASTGFRADDCAWCLEVHDLVLSKCAAGRERDWHYAREALRAQIVDPDVLLVRVPDLPVSDEVIAHVDAMLRQSSMRKRWRLVTADGQRTIVVRITVAVAQNGYQDKQI